MRAACYCRVSTDKEEQLQSLSKQLEFFEDFVESKGHQLFRIYADEGISGKQLKNRVQFIQMIKDAENKRFDILYVKDISRFARNTEDFLHNIRKIKSFGIDIFFITNNLNIKEGSEFYLTILAAMAQEESAKLSERVKFGKGVTAKNGRVPNFVFGYDKVDRYTLVPNPQEKEIVQKIFDLYVNENYGTSKIASYLNDNNITTKKNKQRNWHQVVVTQILRNEIYIGRIVNRKSEVIDFITGKRKIIDKDKRIVVEKPELQIISTDIFESAQRLLEEKRNKFNLVNKRESVKFPLSNLIKCSECRYSFRRCQRKYSDRGKTYKWWACSFRNAKGVNACINHVNADEEVLEGAIGCFFKNLVSNKVKATKYITSEINELIKQHNSSIINNRKETEKELSECIKQKEKYMDMYKNEVINIDELKSYTKDLNERIQKLKTCLALADNSKEINVSIEKSVESYFEKIEEFINKDTLDNQFLKQIIDRILVYPNGTVKIFLKVDNQHEITLDMPLDTIEIPMEETAPFTNHSTQGCYRKTIAD